MELFIQIILSPQARPYEIAFIVLIAGVVFAAFKQKRWIWNLLIFCDSAAVALAFAMGVHFGNYSGLAHFGDTICAGFASIIFAVLTVVTITVRYVTS